MEQIKVLVVDDSSLMRKLIKKMLEEDSEISVSDVAMNGLIALQKIEKNPPDIILLDIEMPTMDGMEFLLKRQEMGIEIPVIVLSSVGKNRPQLTLKALELGAKDFIMKPSGTISLDIEKVQGEVIAKIKGFCRKQIQEKEITSDHEKTISEQRKTSEQFHARRIERTVKANIEEKAKRAGHIDAVAIGISTGGPNALREILPMFPADFPLPILIVQHMPPGFTFEFSLSLDEICPMKVKEAENDELVYPGVIYIAPAGKHTYPKRNSSGQIHLVLDDSVPISGHKPSCDVLFKAVSEVYKNHCVSIIMTGMGKDGAEGIKNIWQSGGITLAQDESSCVVFGMPRAAIELGAIDEIISLQEIPNKVMEILSY